MVDLASTQKLHTTNPFHARGQCCITITITIQRADSSQSLGLSEEGNNQVPRLGTCSRDPIGYGSSDRSLYQYVRARVLIGMDPKGHELVIAPGPEHNPGGTGTVFGGGGQFPTFPIGPYDPLGGRHPTIDPSLPPPGSPGFWDEYLHFLQPGNNAPVDPFYLNWGSETGFCVAAGAATGAGTVIAGGVEVTVLTGGNVFKVVCRKWKCGFRIDPAHHGKPWGHTHWWNW